MRIGLAQLNLTVGDLAGNRDQIIAAYRDLVAHGAELVIFPELAVCGYPPRDLLRQRRFGDDAESALLEIAAATGPVPALVGALDANPHDPGRPFFNTAALCHDGVVQGFARKCLLPTYDVFDEDRYFEPFDRPTVFVVGGRRIGVTVCEDLWAGVPIAWRYRHRFDPVARLAEQPALDLMVNLSASPWHAGKLALRQQLVRDAARRLHAPVAYVNAVGGNDELIFDGRSMVADATGELLTGLPAYAPATRIVDLQSAPVAADPSFADDGLAALHDALVLGLRDYVRKTGFERVLVALSGGIDSAVVGALAVAALGPDKVTGVALPSAYSSAHSLADAEALAVNLGITLQTFPIADAVAATTTTLAPALDPTAPGVTEENVQARLRGVFMMALSNQTGALLLTTGNKSELAVGYCTLYGDMCGGLAVISDLYKTQVYALAQWINRESEMIPVSTLTKAPSAELRPDQCDADSLPPYDVLDPILRAYIEDGCSIREIVDQGFAPTIVKEMVRKVDLNEYKRRQAAPGLKVTPLAFGVGRRLPLAQGYVR
ncbi:NAD+ synthase [Actomonas aquatica]|uniref:Glutamine-dependent NAD(+) synthetase n=1 Tax=Actomonas aquatica TaxID=2866162 RepID=A0ABZ1CAL3_9BACT|nr:NAD+ synthase [Opitutus sp. WL0086]WRQ88342.1 NAD+ synthase [Opitutus sp. WL0086]